MKKLLTGLVISFALLFGPTAQADKMLAYNKSNGEAQYHGCFLGLRNGITAYRNTKNIEFAVDEFIGTLFSKAKYVKIGSIYAFDYQSFKKEMNKDFDNGYTYRGWLKYILKTQIDNVGDPYLDFQFKRRLSSASTTFQKQCKRSFGQFNRK